LARLKNTERHEGDEQLKLDLELDENLTIDQLEAAIAQISSEIASRASRLGKLRRLRGSKIGSSKSVQKRRGEMEGEISRVRAIWDPKRHERSDAVKIADQLGLKQRSVRKYMNIIRNAEVWPDK
jgi:hypothetical protein